MIELLGWSASIIFAVSGLPQAYRCFRQGHARGLSRAMMWFVGEGLAISYGHLASLPTPILFNYYVNFFSLCVIMRYRYFPVLGNEEEKQRRTNEQNARVSN